MSIPDSLIIRYFELVTDIHPDILLDYAGRLKSGEMNPKDAKMMLAYELTRLYYNDQAAKEAEYHFKNVFQNGKLPEKMNEVQLTHGQSSIYRKQTDESETGYIDLVQLLIHVGFVKSNSDARRLIQAGAVKINGEKVTSLHMSSLSDGDILHSGKLNFVKINIR